MMKSKHLRWCKWIAAIGLAFVIAACGNDSQIAGPSDDASPQSLGKPAAKMAAGYQQQIVVTATVTQDGTPVSGAEVAIGKSTAGKATSFDWTGTTDATGKAVITVETENAPYASGYYAARATQSGNVIGTWHSIPLNGGNDIALTLAIGAKAQITTQSRSSGGPIPQGALIEDFVTSPALEGDLLGYPSTRPLMVYLPPSYSKTAYKHYPVAYMLHGYGSNQTYFTGGLSEFFLSETGIELGMYISDIADKLIAAGDMQEMILVMPDGSNLYGGSWYERSPLIGDYRTYIAEDLVKYIDGKYRTLPDRKTRGIGGHSMGGYGALSLAMEYHNTFGAVASMSPGWPNDFAQTETAFTARFTGENPGDTPKPPIPIASIEDLILAFRTQFNTNAFYSMAAAWSPNLTNAPTYVDLPIKYPEKTTKQDVWDKWIQRDLTHQIARDGANLSDTPIYVDQGVGPTLVFPEVLAIDRVLAALDAAGLSYTYNEVQGDHLTHLKEQVTASLKFLSAHLSSQ